jgi:uncharacterized protein YndB with AHSA1/START domain
MTETGTGVAIAMPSDLEIAVTRTFQAPAQLVFDAWTKPEHLKRWFAGHEGVLAVCEIDLRVGGAWRFVAQSEAGEMGMYGEYLEVDAPSRLVSTENFDEPYFEVMGGGTVNTMTLDERDGVTTMMLCCRYKSKEARDSALATPMDEGMNESLDQLAELLETLA